MVCGAGSRRRPRGLVAAALLCAAVVGVLTSGGGVAFAQDATVWSATLTAGKDALGGDVWGWRSIPFAMNGDNLTDTTVTFEGVDYPLYSILVVQVTDFNERLILSFSGLTTSSGGLFDPDVQRALEFRVGEESFNLGDTHRTLTGPGTLSFQWDFTDLYWTTGDEYALSLVDLRPKVRSAKVIDPYYVEVTFNQEVVGHMQPWAAVTVRVNGTTYPTNWVTVQCKAAGGRCPATGPREWKWLWIELQWPIFQGDSVTFSYSAEDAGGEAIRGGGHSMPTVTNYTVTNGLTSAKPTVTLTGAPSSHTAGNYLHFNVNITGNGASVFPSRGAQNAITGNAGTHGVGAVSQYSGLPVNIGFDWDSTWGGAPNSVRRVLDRGTGSTVPSRWRVRQWIDADAGGHGPLDITASSTACGKRRNRAAGPTASAPPASSRLSTTCRPTGCGCRSSSRSTRRSAIWTCSSAAASG